MKIKVSDFKCDAILCLEMCKFSSTCANHDSAGDFRNEGGFKPELIMVDNEVHCETYNQEISDYDDCGNLPKNHGQLSSGLVVWDDIKSPDLSVSLESIFGPTYRLTISADGKEFMGMSVKGTAPKRSGEILPVLKEIVRMLEAPDLPDEWVLGKYSPTVSTVKGVGEGAKAFLEANPDFWPGVSDKIPDSGVEIDNNVPVSKLTKDLESIGVEQSKRMDGLI